MSSDLKALKIFKRYIEGNILWGEFIDYVLASDEESEELIEFALLMKQLYKKYQYGIR